MTREEAIDILRCRKDGDAAEALEVVLKIAEAEPCEDAVSREAVINMLPTFGRPTKKFDYILSVLHDIRALPPVTPKQRIGRWIDDKCSVCGKGIEDLISSPEWYRNEEPKFCPYCGIKLEGESE